MAPHHLLILPVILHLARVVGFHAMARAHFARPSTRAYSDERLPGVSLVRPIRGLDSFAIDNHGSLFEQDYPGEYEILFCAERDDDPGLDVVRSLQARYPTIAARIVSSRDVDAAGLMRNVLAGTANARHEVIVFSDSDVRLSAGFLKVAVHALADPRVGLAFCVPIMEGAENWVAALFGSAVNETAVAVPALSRLGAYGEAVGATMAIRRGVIAEIGGMEQFRDMVTHDVPLARAVRHRGYRIRVLREPAHIRHEQDRFRRAYAHLLRWLVIIRSYHPIAILLGLFDLPVYWGLSYLAVAAAVGGTGIAGGVALTMMGLIVRPASTALMEGRLSTYPSRRGFFWTRCLHELLRLPLLVHASFTREFEWRGRHFRVGRGGRVAEERLAQVP